MSTKLKAIVESILVKCSLEDVWNAWTTEEGVRNFFAPDCRIELKAGGSYEMYFMPNAPAGSKGGEGNRILAIEPMKLFSFTWNAPPQYPQVREHKTSVCVRFETLSDKSVGVTLEHIGWGSSDEWQQVFLYFQKAWSDIVLPRLKKYLEGNPVIW